MKFEISHRILKISAPIDCNNAVFFEMLNNDKAFLGDQSFNLLRIIVFNTPIRMFVF